MKIDGIVSGCININGRNFKGKSVVIDGQKITIDGVDQPGSIEGDLVITIHGDVDSVQSGRGDVNCQKVNNVSTVSGDVECGDVTGNVSTISGDIDCVGIEGNVSTVSGDVAR
jgi:hypothetical protein